MAAGPTTASGKHAKGAVKNGTSVDEIKTKLHDGSSKSSATGRHAAAQGASSSAAN